MGSRPDPVQGEPSSIPSPVLAQVQAILRKDPQADRIALVWPEPVEPPESVLRIGETGLRFVYCPSELAIRELLVAHPVGSGAEPPRLVLLSPFDETRLGKDVLARLWGLEPKRISPWRTLEQLTQVREIDPRLTRKDYRWIAECLVSNYDRYRDEVHFGSVLDFDKAWQAVALGLLGFSGDVLDLDALLDWSRGPDAGEAVATLPGVVREHLEDWLSPRLGDLTQVLLALWQRGHASAMVAIGLACSLIYRDRHSPSQTLLQARGRFRERYLGGAQIAEESLAAFGAETLAYADRAARQQALTDLMPHFSEAERVLASLDQLALAVDCDLLPEGYRLRLDAFAKALGRAVDGKATAEALGSLAVLCRHRLAQARQEQVETAELAMRACLWLQTDEIEHGGLGAEIRDYLENGGHLDWARSRLWAGDEHEGLSRVYARLTKRISERRERINQRFGSFLSAIARGDQVDPAVLPVEQAIGGLLAPLAKQQPVLLLVLDGMSLAVYHELTGDLLRQGWVELRPTESQEPGCLLAALPTITRVSRYSLLAGTLGEGGNTDEKKAFESHPALKVIASTKFPPQLLHKADLQQPGSGALAERVREQIAGQQHRIIAAVINAIDDQLSSGAQLAVRWSIGSISLLRQILEAARESGRLVVFTSDHGHVLEHDMRLAQAATEGERYKPATEAIAPGELLVEGSRVRVPGQRVILPWSEKIRYASKKMGYHGGGTPQEVLIPWAIYRTAGELDPVPGWQEVPRQHPPWWSLDFGATGVKWAAPRPTKFRQSPPSLTLDLFDQAPEAALPNAPAAGSDWITALFASPVYAQMRSRAGRVMIPEDQLVRLLDRLANAGGQQMTGALAQALEIPAIRIHGLLAGAQKLLNVDGYPVLSIDRASKTVRLDVESLKTQFEL